MGRCLAALRGSDGVNRVIVVDNASDDGSAEVARRAGADVVLQNGVNVGFAAAVNTGLAHATAEHTLLLNPDAELRPGALAGLLRALLGTTAAVVAAPLLRDHAGRLHSGAGRFATVPRRVGLCLPLARRVPALRHEYHLSEAQLRDGRPLLVDYVFGAAMLVDHHFLADSGGLDERFFLFAEDEDLCRRARHAGRRVVLATQAVAQHAGGASCGDEALTEAQRLYSNYRLLEKWHGRRAAGAYHGGLLVALWARQVAALAAGRPSQAATVVRLNEAFASAVRDGSDPLRPPQPPAGTGAAP